MAGWNTTCSFLLGFRLIFRCYVMLVPGRGNLMPTISSMSQHLCPSLRLGREEIFVTDRFQKRKRPPLYCWRVLRKAPRSFREYEGYVILSQRLETSMQVLFSRTSITWWFHSYDYGGCACPMPVNPWSIHFDAFGSLNPIFVEFTTCNGCEVVNLWTMFRCLVFALFSNHFPWSLKSRCWNWQEITNELLPSLVVDHPTGFAPLDACIASVPWW